MILKLYGEFALWLASEEAAFLAGRFVCANWDVDELKARAEEIEQSPSLLRMGLILTVNEAEETTLPVEKENDRVDEDSQSLIALWD